jgi:peptidase M23-like protein
MQERIIFYISILIISIFSLSFKWPLNNGRVTSTFGESRADHFHDGIDIVNFDNKIYSVESGELLFLWDKNIFPLEQYPGGGNYKVIEHENLIYSIYMHLADGLPQIKKYNKYSVLGNVGNTGHSFSSHLHFSLLNANDRSSLNPYIKLSDSADLEAPVIKGFYIKIKDKYILLRDGSDIRLTKHYAPLIQIVDSISKRERLGVYKLKAFLNGREVLNITFDQIDFSESGLLVDKYHFNKIFDKKGYYRIPDVKYADGENKFKFIASDYSGNVSEKEFAFIIDLDIN